MLSAARISNNVFKFIPEVAEGMFQIEFLIKINAVAQFSRKEELLPTVTKYRKIYDNGRYVL